ncbi:hypothetical protein ACFWIB_07615 [Streptomyces sp. NPDC127051]|uniref:hypothetical protein n=1 Tax=Streptomyces sp. NPDC127051 TaxID=3347119 RepID=UPI003661564A
MSAPEGSYGMSLSGVMDVLAMFAGGLAGALLVRAGRQVTWLLVPPGAVVLAEVVAYLPQPRLHAP